jgi:hypothetical protein
MVYEASLDKPLEKSHPYIVAAFPPPPLIGRVHDLLMTYTKVYRNFCFDIFGKILLKNTDFENPKTYTTY